MNRAFIYLYIVIVVSVVAIGWGIDKLWQAFSPNSQSVPYEEAFFRAIEDELRKTPSLTSVAALESVSVRLSEKTQLEVKVYLAEELAQSALTSDILSGAVVTVFNHEGYRISYKHVLRSPHVIQVKQKQHQPNDGHLYHTFIIIFYLGIAIVVYFWVWPLSKDLRQLETQTRSVGKDGVPENVDLGPGSAVYELASAFNGMADRIRDLIASHKEMTYAVSHELRTPLARMKFALEIANENKSLEEKEKQIKSIRQDILEMEELINELLTYAGFEQANQQLDIKPGELRALVKSTIAAASEHADNINFTLIDMLNDPDVYCEWYLMERCFHNLIQNAMRYAKSHVRVTLSDADSVYKISIEDDGPGIPDNEKERVFQAFVRLRNEDHAEKSGFGLGLAIVHRILKWHKGRVCVEDSALGGAKFIISWPR